MATFLLDTNIIIDTLNAKKNRGLLLAELVGQGHILACCPINIAEVYAGLRAREEERTEALLQSLRLLPITFPIAQLAGLLKGDYGRKGKTLSLPDTVVAAVAIHHGIHLVTDNIADFPMPDLLLYPLKKAD
jgi:predicted nucleic acid-binding protein